MANKTTTPSPRHTTRILSRKMKYRLHGLAICSPTVPNVEHTRWFQWNKRPKWKHSLPRMFILISHQMRPVHRLNIFRCFFLSLNYIPLYNVPCLGFAAVQRGLNKMLINVRLLSAFIQFQFVYTAFIGFSLVFLVQLLFHIARAHQMRPIRLILFWLLYYIPLSELKYLNSFPLLWVSDWMCVNVCVCVCAFCFIWKCVLGLLVFTLFSDVSVTFIHFIYLVWYGLAWIR